ncbi:MAG: tRNA (cytidine(34)-2'-O)-methyltransferase [Pirellulales bacterium]
MKYDPELHIVLYQPEIPHNAGSVGRTCVAVGAKLWMVRPLGFRVDDYHLRRAGLDYWEHLEWEVVDDWTHLSQRLGESGVSDRLQYYLTKRGTRSYLDVAYGRGDVFVFGSESQGLPDSMIAQAGDRALKIPIRPAVRSLNLSNSVAVVAYEALRQWSHDT